MSTALKRVLPLFDRVLIQRIKPAERTASGLFIPEKAQQTLNEGVVIAVGPGSLDTTGTLHACSVKAGEKVLLPAYGGDQIKIDQEEYLLFRDSEILAKLK